MIGRFKTFKKCGTGLHVLFLVLFNFNSGLVGSPSVEHAFIHTGELEQRYFQELFFTATHIINLGLLFIDVSHESKVGQTF